MAIEGESSFHNPSIENYFHPVPRVRLDKAEDAFYKVGDQVKALVGPAFGRIGSVLIDKNGNYEDYETYVSLESIGVVFVEREKLDPVLQQVVEELIDHEATVRRVLRWFDSPDQLELVHRSE